jgi:3-hydroxyacyl-[acyl-carrier-protein] dehydratase
MVMTGSLPARPGDFSDRGISFIFRSPRTGVKTSRKIGGQRESRKTMLPEKLFDLSKVDFGRVEYPLEEIRKINLQRFEFEQVHGIHGIYPEEEAIVGYRDVREDEFWVRGHIPGSPLFPGVLMIEAAAQLCSFYQGRVHPTDGFFGFGGVEAVRFRAAVRPGDKMILVGKGIQIHPRKSTFATQIFVKDTLAFEGTIIGVNIRRGKL